MNVKLGYSLVFKLIINKLGCLFFVPALLLKLMFVSRLTSIAKWFNES
jgi:hypothetical protein